MNCASRSRPAHAAVTALPQATVRDSAPDCRLAGQTACPHINPDVDQHVLSGLAGVAVGSTVEVTGDEAHHAVAVRRLRVGEPVALTPLEFEEMKQHTAYGVSALRSAALTASRLLVVSFSVSTTVLSGVVEENGIRSSSWQRAPATSPAPCLRGYERERRK